MATVKENVRAMLKRMPDNCSIEDVMYELYVIQKVERGLEAVDRGEGIPHEQVMKEAYKCLLKSSGRRKLAKT